MSHKREFFIEYPKYHMTVIKKGKQFLDDIKNLLPEEECDKYVAFINEIEQFND